MRRSLTIAALMATTALTPASVRADPITAFVTQFVAGIGGAGAATVGGAVVGGSIGTAGFLAGSSLGAFFGTAIGGAIGNLLLSVGLSAIAQALAPKPSFPSPSERFVNFAQPITSMEAAFGRVRKGGPYALSVFRDDRRHYGVILAAHQIDGIEQWYLDERQVSLAADSDLVETTPYDSYYVSLRPYLGAPGQAADATLVSDVPGWTAAHDMAGLAYVATYARQPAPELFSELYGNSPQTGPAVTAVLRGALVYDPRSDVRMWSNNAALVWAWITTERLGQAVDWDEVAAEANVCDELVTNREGQQQRRWTLNGTFSDDMSYEDLRSQIIAACDGYMFEKPDGTLGFRVGRYIEPTLTLDERSFFSLSVSENDWGAAPPTEFVGRYVEPDYRHYESTTGTWVVDADAVPVRKQVSLFFVDSHNQAVRVIKRMARASLPRYTVEATLGPIGYELVTGHRFVRIRAHGYDFVAEVSKLSRGANLALFTLNAVSTDASDFAFDALIEEPARPPRETLEGSNTVPTVATLSGSAVAGGIEWSWPEQDSQYVQQFEVRDSGAAVWQPARLFTENETSVLTGGVVDGVSYEARIRNRTGTGRSGDWTESPGVVATTNLTPPAPVTGFFATVDGTSVDLGWVTPNDANYFGTRIYRTTGSVDINDAVLIGPATLGPPNTAQVETDAGLGAGTYVYWAVSTNESGVEGAFAGPETVEVT